MVYWLQSYTMAPLHSKYFIVFYEISCRGGIFHAVSGMTRSFNDRPERREIPQMMFLTSWGTDDKDSLMSNAYFLLPLR